MFWFHFALGIVVTALQSAVKNPASVARERAVLLEIRDLIDQVLGGMLEPPSPPRVQ